jgi:predicted Zn-dependent peptidase
MRQQLGLIAKTDAERLELMQNVKVDDVRAHYKRTHFAPNMRFVIAGNLSAQRRTPILTMLEEIDLPTTGNRFELPVENPLSLKRPVYIENDTVENLYFYIDTFMKRRMDEPETDALSLVNTLLTETLYSKILGTARERGLVYGMNSGISYTRDVSNWWFGSQVSDKNAQALLDITVEELSKVMTGDISDEDIEATKQYSLGRYHRSGQTVGSMASAYAGRYFFDEFINNYYRLPERIEAVSKQGIIDISKAMFADNLWGIGILGNCGETFAHELQQQIEPLWQPASKLKLQAT